MGEGGPVGASDPPVKGPGGWGRGKLCGEMKGTPVVKPRSMTLSLTSWVTSVSPASSEAVIFTSSPDSESTEVLETRQDALRSGGKRVQFSKVGRERGKPNKKTNSCRVWREKL